MSVPGKLLGCVSEDEAVVMVLHLELYLRYCFQVDVVRSAIERFHDNLSNCAPIFLFLSFGLLCCCHNVLRGG